MVRLLVLALLAFGAWKSYEHYQTRKLSAGQSVRPGQSERLPALDFSSKPSPAAANFACDGRKYCSQMTSCAEATYFLRNCPGVKMDGNNDGVPCEQQWCR